MNRINTFAGLSTFVAAIALSAEGTAGVAKAAPKTLEEQLVIAQARVASLQAKISAAAVLNNIAAGNEVEFAFGRGEKARTLTGTVSAVADTENGKVAIVVCDAGTIDQQQYKVRVADVTRNITVEAEQAEAGEDAAVEGEDPLAQD